jgi:uncharacterized surface protein with fasciclin (FAS1) repeats
MFSAVSAQKYAGKPGMEVTSEWNGTTFSSTKTFSENIKDIESFSILNGILMDEALSKAIVNEEMVTIFAPLNTSFDKMKKADRKELLEDKSRISKTIKYLIIPGRVDLNSIKRAVYRGGTTMELKTLSGENLKVKMVDGKVLLFDAQNNTAELKATNFYHKNGLFHIVDGLVYPKPAEEKKF